jgi:hypothetical protein
MKKRITRYLIQFSHKVINKKEWGFLIATARNAETYKDKIIGNALFKSLLKEYIPLSEICMRIYVKKKMIAYNKK